MGRLASSDWLDAMREKNQLTGAVLEWAELAELVQVLAFASQLA